MSLKIRTTRVLRQICHFIDSIDNSIYTKQLDIFGGSSVGQHFRHIHGFYHCLLTGAEAGVVNYDKRTREISVESDCNSCKECFSLFEKEIENLNLSQEVFVVEGINNEILNGKIKSSVGRELLYALDHAIHHLAIIKMGMRSDFPEIIIDKNLGVASSTLEYQKTVCVQ